MKLAEDEVTGIASDAGRKLADTIIKHPRRLPDEIVSELLERSALRLADQFRLYTVPDDVLERALDAFAASCLARLATLEQALRGDGGKA